MTGTIRTTTVQGTTYEVWGDFIRKGTMAKNTETGEVKQISYSGYVSNDLRVRKEIACHFGLSSFRK